MKNTALIAAGIIFLIVSIAHFLRYYKAMPIVVDSFSVPLEWSLYGGLIAGLLALWMLIAANKK